MNDQPADIDSIPAFLDRRASKPLVYSYTLLNQYRNCAHAAYRKYVKRDIPWVQSEAAKHGDEGHQAMERRIGSRQQLPEKFIQAEKHAAAFDGRNALVEQKLAMTREGRVTGYWDADCFFRGKADTVVRQGTKAYIRDWKFGSSKYEDPFELETNALLLKVKYPELELVRGDYCYIKEDRVGQSYDLARFQDTWNEIMRLVALIEADRASGEFEKRRSGLCGWCDVKDCENNRKQS